MPLALALPALTAAVATASAVSDPVDARGYPTIEAAWRLSTLSAGTASLQVESSEDGEDWEPLGDPVALTQIGKVRATRDGAFRWVRLRVTVAGGTGTWKVTGNALQVYGTLEDLYATGINEEALSKITLARKHKAMAKGSDTALGYLRKAPNVALPMTSWGGDLAAAVAKIGAYDLRSGAGYQPTKEEENSLRQRYKDAIAWLESVAAGDVLLDDGDDSNGGPGLDVPEVYSDKPWGF